MKRVHTEKLIRIHELHEYCHVNYKIAGNNNIAAKKRAAGREAGSNTIQLHCVKIPSEKLTKPKMHNTNTCNRNGCVY